MLQNEQRCTENEMAETISRIGDINRADCRARVEKKFSIERIIEEYEHAFLSLL